MKYLKLLTTNYQLQTKVIYTKNMSRPAFSSGHNNQIFYLIKENIWPGVTMTHRGFAFLNILLGFLALSLLVSYIFITNHIVSQSYKINELKSGLNETKLQLSGLNQDIDPTQLASFAKSRGMVAVAGHEVIFVNSNVVGIDR